MNVFFCLWLLLPATTSFLTPLIWPRCSRALTRPHAVMMEGWSDSIQKETEAKMKKSVEAVDGNLNSVRTGRASTVLLDRINVDYYGVSTPLNQLAGVSVSGPQSLVISPYDKGAIKSIESAILESDLGLNPSNEGSVLRLNIPPLTEDRRKELGKVVKGLGEEGKVAVRNVRRDAVDKIKKLEKEKTLGKDESLSAQESLQKVTDKYVKMIDGLLKSKEKEVMTV